MSAFTIQLLERQLVETLTATKVLFIYLESIKQVF